MSGLGDTTVGGGGIKATGKVILLCTVVPISLLVIGMLSYCLWGKHLRHRWEPSRFRRRIRRRHDDAEEKAGQGSKQSPDIEKLRVDKYAITYTKNKQAEKNEVQPLH